jgi:cytochrome c
MKKSAFLVLLAAGLIPTLIVAADVTETSAPSAEGFQSYPVKPKLLVYSEIGQWRDPEHKLKGFYHKSIQAGVQMLKNLAEKYAFELVVADTSNDFTDAGLAPFQAIIFLNPNGYILNESERSAFQKFIRSGKGYVGIHAAANCELDWPWYMTMLGAYETGVNANKASGTIVVQDHAHASTKNLPTEFTITDEWLKYDKDVRTLNDPAIKILTVVKEDCYRPGATTTHPIAWYRAYEGGRVWYTGFGHHAAVFSDAHVIEHIWGGIQYAVGKP